MKNDFVKPVLVLTLICLIISAALAVTNGITEPVIAEAAAIRTEAAMFDIIPEAAGFEEIIVDGLPETVREVHKSTNDVGYVFIIETGGYGGDILLICGVGPDGSVLRCTTLEHSETKGLGSKIAEAQFEEQFTGADDRLSNVEAITGATISSSAYIEAIRDALKAFEVVCGATSE